MFLSCIFRTQGDFVDTESIIVTWSHNNKEIARYKDGDVLNTSKAFLFETELQRGNASLCLRNVQVEDKGEYICHVVDVPDEGKVRVRLEGVVADKSYKCCPDLWIKCRKNCYYFSVNKTTWDRSSWQCDSHGSQLAVAEDEEELDFLIDYCRSYFTFWIGLKRNPEDGWTWINEQLFNLSWKTNVQEESGDCACVLKQSVQIIDKPNKCCSDMWTKYKENCYYFSTNKTTWERSSQQCVSYGSQLVVAEDEEVLTFLIGCCRAYLTFWIGLNRKPEETWTWINGQHFDLNWWTLGVSAGGHCACVAQESIESLNCSSQHHWICRMAVANY
ncbi:CD69 protein, partial [Polypterus senegalus]